MSRFFLDALRSSRVLLMDGAMGTELLRAGLKPDECGELWNLTHPERVQAIHRAYVDAGAEVLLTNTFQANPSALERNGLRDRCAAIYQAAQNHARSACGPNHFVLTDLGPLPDEVSSGIRGRYDDFKELFPLATATDGLLLETQCGKTNALLVVQLQHHELRRLPSLPILLSFTYRRKQGQLITRHGLSPEQHAEWHASFARTFRDFVALGVNCGRDIGMDETIEIIHRYRRVTDLPVFARPNAGTPIRVGDQWVYPRSPEEMAARLPELLEAGVCMVGGCCGTTPAHIAAFRKVIDVWNARHA
jgi:5-methyltetrahydrofolate--homocysteine methyltransferase